MTRIIFFGTSEFGAIILEKLIHAKIRPLLVVTVPDKPVGRKQLLTPPPVKSHIMKHKWNIPILQPENLSTISNQLSAISPDLMVLAAYGQVIPKEILKIPRYDALNVHPSLLPKYRGPSPIQTAILNGDEETGVTIMLMDEQIDHGPIVASEKFKMKNQKFTYPELHDTLAKLGGELLIKTIPKWVKGEIMPQPQNHAKATSTKRIAKQHGHIDWSKPALYIERQTRALNPWPGTYSFLKVETQDLNPQILKILRARVLEGTYEKAPGKTFLTTSGKLAVQTQKDALLVEELQLQGGKPMPAREFLLGHKDFVGTILA
ncbi:MAG: methionyl-tRNA formyltransferase [Patescibacteria group bacterium]